MVIDAFYTHHWYIPELLSTTNAVLIYKYCVTVDTFWSGIDVDAVVSVSTSTPADIDAVAMFTLGAAVGAVSVKVIKYYLLAVK